MTKTLLIVLGLVALAALVGLFTAKRKPATCRKGKDGKEKDWGRGGCC